MNKYSPSLISPVYTRRRLASIRKLYMTCLIIARAAGADIPEDEELEKMYVEELVELYHNAKWPTK